MQSQSIENESRKNIVIIVQIKNENLCLAWINILRIFERVVL